MKANPTFLFRRDLGPIATSRAPSTPPPDETRAVPSPSHPSPSPDDSPEPCSPSHDAAADWNQTGYAKFGGNRYSSGQGGASTVFNFFANDDDAEFSLVDNKPAPRTRFGAKRFQQRNFMRRDQTAFVGGDVGQGATRERALRGFFIARRRLRFARRRADICAMRQPPACAAG